MNDTEKDLKMQKLIKFIESHGNKVLSHTDDTITAECVYCKNGVAYTVAETFPATVAAARNWLGY